MVEEPELEPGQEPYKAPELVQEQEHQLDIHIGEVEEENIHIRILNPKMP